MQFLHDDLYPEWNYDRTFQENKTNIRNNLVTDKLRKEEVLKYWNS